MLIVIVINLVHVRLKMNIKLVPDIHLPDIPGFKLPNAPELPTGKSIIRFVTDKITTNNTAKSKVVIREEESKKLRPLTSGEIAMCKKVFKDSIEYTKVRIINEQFLPKQQVPMTPLGHAHYPDGMKGRDKYQNDFSNPQFKENPIQSDGSDWRIKSKLTFIHEMTHVWQYQKGMNVIGKGALLQTLEWTLPDAIYDPYAYDLKINSVFKKFNPEQQANIASDYFGLISGYNEINFSQAWRHSKNQNSVEYLKNIMKPIIYDPVGYELVRKRNNLGFGPFMFLVF